MSDKPRDLAKATRLTMRLEFLCYPIDTSKCQTARDATRAAGFLVAWSRFAGTVYDQLLGMLLLGRRTVECRRDGRSIEGWESQYVGLV
jgi:hypothetical protein